MAGEATDRDLAMLVTLAAAVLTILVLLVFAARAGDISFSSSSNGSASLAAGATKISAPAQTREPAWLSNPLAPPFQQRTVLPWTSSIRK